MRCLGEDVGQRKMMHRYWATEQIPGEAGLDEVYIGQVGPDQDGFFEFYSGDVLPRLREA